jgi:hypothetical protein
MANPREEPRPEAPDVSGLRERARGLYARALAEAREGISAVQAAHLDPPARGSALRRFGYGLALPLALLRALLRDPAARRRYLRTVGLQAAITLVAGVFFALASRDGADLIPGEGQRVVVARALAFWSSLYATLCAVEWGVIALSRDHHGAIARDLSLLTGVPPEDDDTPPRVRLDLKWIFRQLRNKVRGFLVFASVLPLAAVLARIPDVGPAMSWVVLGSWTIYWYGVFAAAKTAYGWTDESSAPDPFFLRVWNESTAPLPSFLAWMPRTYARIWGWAVRPLAPPARRFEESPYELSGLALARLLRHVPILYAMLRPIFTVAAAHILVARERERAAEEAHEKARVDALFRIVSQGSEAEVEAQAEAEAQAETEAQAEIDARAARAG